MTRAEKRRRKKENTRAAREAREARMKREKRKSIALRVGAAVLLVAAAVGIGAIVTGGDEEDGDAAGGTTTTAPEATTAAPASLPNGCIDKAPEPVENRPTFDSPPEMTIDTAKTYTAKIETSCGYITVSLDDDHAPTGVNNFVTLARAGFYDGLTWHRVVTDFVIQGGDPEGTGSGGPGYQVETELPPDGEYPLGSLAWAKAPNDAAGTAGSQFFIVTGENGTTLPAEYGYFGKVTEGLENAQKIESLAQGDGPPSIPMYIYSIEIVES